MADCQGLKSQYVDNGHLSPSLVYPQLHQYIELVVHGSIDIDFITNRSSEKRRCGTSDLKEGIGFSDSLEEAGRNACSAASITSCKSVCFPVMRKTIAISWGKYFKKICIRIRIRRLAVFYARSDYQQVVHVKQYF